MPWTAPDGSQWIFPWEDGAASGTPLNAADLRAMQVNLESFVLAVGQSLGTYAEGLSAGVNSNSDLQASTLEVTGPVSFQVPPSVAGATLGTAIFNDATDFDAAGYADQAIATYTSTPQSRTATLSGPNPSATDNSQLYGTTAWINAQIAAGVGAVRASRTKGTGTDGTVVLDGTATVAWATLSGGVYTMIRDCYCTDLTINAPLNNNNFRIFATGAIINNSTLGWTATAGSGAGGTSGAAAIPTGQTINQGSGTNGAITSSGAASVGAVGGQAGGGGNGTSGNTGAAGATPALSTLTLFQGRFNFIEVVLTGVFSLPGASTGYLRGGSGGSGGGGDGTNHGGGGGAAGPMIVIVSTSFVNNGTVNAIGGAGGTPTTGNCGGGGGGTGGSVAVYTDIAATMGTINVTGGAAGAGVGTGTAGTAGANGFASNFTAASALPVLIGSPVISGTLASGAVLTVSSGTWTSSPTFAYQWMTSPNSNLSSATNATGSGATTASYTGASGDVSLYVFCQVTASNGNQSTTVRSLPIIAAPVNTGVPAITGTAQQGVQLTCSTGTWTGLGITYAYQAFRINPDGSTTTVSPASSVSTYIPALADVGAQIYFTLTATNAAGVAAVQTSRTAQVAPVAGAAKPANSILPAIVGTPAVGQTLSASPGTWTGSPTFAYQWLSDAQASLRVGCNNISAHSFIPNLVSDFQGIGVTWDRVTVTGPASGQTALIQNSLNLGLYPIVVYGPGANNGVYGTSPSQCASDCVALANFMTPLGLTEIEFGNEVYLNSSLPADYAAQYLAAHDALAGTGVKLLACASGDYATNPPTNSTFSQDANNGGWIRDFLAALVAAGGSAGMVDGWTAHTYCATPTSNGGADTGWANLPTWRSIAVAAGSNAQFYVTEMGWPITGGGFAVAEPTRSQYLTTVLNDCLTRTYIAMFLWYSSTDDGSGTYGLFDVNQTTQVITGERTSFSALGSWMSTNASSVNAGPVAGPAIPNATAATYKPQGSDIGTRLSVQVTAANGAGSAVAVSAATTPVAAGSGTAPVNTTAPVLSGTLTQGQTLTVNTGAWSNSPTSYNYGWRRIATTAPGGTAGTIITGATSASYQLGPADVGFEIYAVVQAVNAAGSTSAYTARSAAVAASGGGGGGGGTLILNGSFAGGSIPSSVYPVAKQSFQAGHVTVVPDPDGNVVSGTGTVVNVLKYAITNTDSPYGGSHPRGDVLTNPVLASGQTLYASMPIRLGSTSMGTYNASGNAFYQFCEAKNNAASFPSWGMGVLTVNGVNYYYFSLDYASGGTSWISPNPIDTSWHCPIVEAYYTSASTGTISLWWDGNPITFNTGKFSGQTQITGIQTINVNSGGGYDSAWPIDIDSYRAFNVYSGTITTYHGGVRIGTTLSSVATESGRVQGP